MRGLLERDSEQLARFQREAEVIEDLRHPNIVQMFEYAVLDESPYLVMEYIPGPSLATYLKKLHDRRERLPIGMVAHLIKSIGSALDYAHLKGLVHRDIKPANVLLRSQAETVELNQPLPEDVEPILTDFGLVRLLDSTMLTTAGSVSGTPTYMSPEQARGEKVDKSTDIYALGIMLYEMLAGTVPFQSDTTFGMLMKHINEPPPPIPGISTDLQALIDRALAKDPTLRYQSAGDLANEFIAIFNGQTISPGTLHIAEMARQAAEASQQSKTQPQESRTRRFVRLGIEIAVVLGAVLLLFQFINRDQTTLVATPSPALDPNIPVGRLRLEEFDAPLDSAVFLSTNIPAPEAGFHYEAWLISDDGTQVKDIGAIIVNEDGRAELNYTEPTGQNLLGEYSAFQITQERDNQPTNRPTGEVLYSSVFPPEALVPLRKILVSFDGAPGSEALMQGLYYYSGSYIDFAVNGDELIDPDYVPLVEAYENDDEATVRDRIEEIINLIVGEESDLYSDYNDDGVINNGESNGFGSLPNGDRRGYLEETTLHLQAAHDAADSTFNIRSQSEKIQICVENMEGWTNEILPLALQLNEMEFGPEMKPLIDEISVLTANLLNGVDVDEDGIEEPITGECGVTQAYQLGEQLADLPILRGPDRIPPSGK